MEHRPARTCIGCRAVCPADELVRVTVDAEGALVAPARHRPGRGAWLHPLDKCIEAAIKARAFGRSFRQPVSVPGFEGLAAALKRRD